MRCKPTIYKFLLLIFTITSAITAQIVFGESEAENFKVVYVPLYICFYGAPSPALIEESGLTFELTSQSISELYTSVDKGTPYYLDDKADDGGLRIKISRKRDDRTIWITKGKKVISGDKYISCDEEVLNTALQEIVNRAQEINKPFYNINTNCNSTSIRPVTHPNNTNGDSQVIE